MTTLFGWGPMFGLPCPSPFVMKADIQLQLFGVAFDRAIADLDSVSKHKAPYVQDDGQIIQDSTFIRWHFEKKLGVDLDEGLSEAGKATAWAFERMLEDRLARIEGHERWLEGDNFERGPAMFFLGAPEAVRAQVIANAVAGVRTGVIAGCTAPIFDTPLKAMVASHANLVAYLERMKDRFFQPNRWPAMFTAREAQAA